MSATIDHDAKATNKLADCALSASLALSAFEAGGQPSAKACVCLDAALRDLTAIRDRLQQQKEAA